MIGQKKVVVVLPAYNASRTLRRTYEDIPFDIVDEVVLVDDGSSDNTMEIARQLGIRHAIGHERNMGYGRNQKTCYMKALELGADIVFMLHPDYQYTPKLIRSMAYLIADGVYPVVFGSRILGKGALRGGMPLYKYVANRFLTLVQNILMGQKLSEYHTGYRAFDRRVLETVRFNDDSDSFVFDNEIVSQIFFAGYDIAEITCPTRYAPDVSSINFVRGLVYGLGVLGVSFTHLLLRMGLYSSPKYVKGNSPNPSRGAV